MFMLFFADVSIFAWPPYIQDQSFVVWWCMASGLWST